MGSMPGSGRYPGVRNGNSFQYAWENPRTEETGGYSKPRLSACAHTHTRMHTHAHTCFSLSILCLLSLTTVGFNTSHCEVCHISGL